MGDSLLTPLPQSCSLSHNNVSMATLLGLTEVAVTCPTIRMLQVSLSGNQLEDEGCRLVAEAAPQLRIARKLDLSLQQPPVEWDEDIPTGTARQRLSQEEGAGDFSRLLMAAPPPLHSLSDNGLSVAGVPWVLRAVSTCRNLADLHISLMHKTVVLMFAPEPEEQEGTQERLTHCGLQAEHLEQLCKALEGSCRLGHLDLRECRLEALSLTHLCEALETCPGPLEVRLSCVVLGDQSLDTLLGHLPRLPQLSLLQLSQTPLSLGSPFLLAQLLSLCPRVEKVDLRLRECSFRPEHMPRLAAGLSQAWHLTELTLSRCCLGLQDLTLLLRLLRRPEGLLRLRVEEPWMGRAGVLTLLQVCAQASGNVTEISISESQQQLCLQLKFPRQENPEAVARRLASSCVSSEGLAPLASGLSRCRHLEELDLSNNQLGEEASTVLAGALEGKSWLRRLDLSHVPLDDSTLAVLAQGLSHMTRLQSLCLSGDDIGDVGCTRLAKALEAATSLEELGLSHNQIGDAGAQHLAAVMPGLPELRRLDLVSCEIDDQAAKLLAASFMLCPALEEILLSWNLLGDEAAAELAQVLPRMQRLKSVDLEKNRITAYGAWLLAEGLAQGSGIQVIRLWNNHIPPDAAQRLQSQEPRLDFAFFPNERQAPRGT
ncbi:Protein NLRC5 [Myotis brandtii]|uniref:Protein NLRC5 n=1 Tax=Myotis brandtii TaxID=109478 RepID=S7PUL9_MYOBR|nr:Protein NLRC5 [Myotis brandtii]